MASYDQYLAGLSPADLAEIKAWEPSKLNMGALANLNLTGGQYGGEMRMFTAPLSNKGNATSQITKNNQFAVTPDANIRLVDNATGQVIYEGTGYDAANRAVSLAQGLTDSGGRKATWDIQATAPGLPGFQTVAHEKKNSNVLGTLADIGLPILGAAIPGLGTLAGMGLGSLASSAAQGRSIKDTLLRAGLTVGTAGLMDKLGVNQAISNALSGSGSSAGSLASEALGSSTIMSDINDMVAGNLASAFGGSAGSSLGGALGDIVVNGIGGSAIPSAVAGGLAGGLAGGIPGTAAAPSFPENITVTGQSPPQQSLPSAPLASIPAASGALGDIVVNGQLPPQPVDQPVASTPAAAFPENITVTGQTQPVQQTPSLENTALGALPGTMADLANNPNINDPQTAPAKTTLDKIVDYLRLGGAGMGVLGSIGSLLGGGNQDAAAGTIPGGLNGGLNPIFSKTLPSNPNIPGVGGAANLTPRTLGGPNQPNIDWNTYGMRPELSFFNYVPKGYARGGDVGRDTYDELSPSEKNFVDYHRRNLAVAPLEQEGALTTVRGMVNRVDGGEMLHPSYIHGRVAPPSEARAWATHSGIEFPVYPDALTALAREQALHEIIDADTARYKRGDRDWLRGYARGGDVAHAGSRHGRSDDVPAMLSDGEYVIDAETVALLGNGSNEAGARQLDAFRVNIRKHKGRSLARGEISPNAKRAEAYMTGGRK